MKKSMMALFLSALSFITAFGASNKSFIPDELSLAADCGAIVAPLDLNPTLRLVKILRDPDAPAGQVLLLLSYGYWILATQFRDAEDEAPRYKVQLHNGNVMYLLNFGSTVLCRFPSEVFRPLTAENCYGLAPANISVEQDIPAKFSECLYVAPENDTIDQDFQ